MEITIKVRDRKGESHNLQVQTDMGMNLLEVIKANYLSMQKACGMVSCGSCQCYILNDKKLSEIGEKEKEILSKSYFGKPNSRLACQILITKDLDGLELQMAPEF